MDAIQIWIDADSCPALVRNHVIKTANKKNLDVFLVANKVIPTHPDLIHKMIVTGSEKDAADNYIFENVKENQTKGKKNYKRFMCIYTKKRNYFCYFCMAI